MSKKRVTKEQQAKFKKILQKLVKEEGNNVCADCNRRNPLWASVNIGVFVCINCSAFHRQMGTHISKVRSLTLDTWLPSQVTTMQNIGNLRANKIYEATLKRSKKINGDVSNYERGDFIKAKYQRKEFYSTSSPSATPEKKVKKKKKKKRKPKPKPVFSDDDDEEEDFYNVDLITKSKPKQSNNNNSNSKTKKRVTTKKNETTLIDFGSNDNSGESLEDLVSLGSSSKNNDVFKTDSRFNGNFVGNNYNNNSGNNNQKASKNDIMALFDNNNSNNNNSRQQFNGFNNRGGFNNGYNNNNRGGFNNGSFNNNNNRGGYNNGGFNNNNNRGYNGGYNNGFSF